MRHGFILLLDEFIQPPAHVRAVHIGVDMESLSGKHVLVVEDIIDTGVYCSSMTVCVTGHFIVREEHLFRRTCSHLFPAGGGGTTQDSE